MKYLRPYAKYLLFIELALAAVLVVGLLVPLPGRVEVKIVQSGSMEPEIPVGAIVAIVPAAKYAVGDVITFGDDTVKRIPTTHRIVSIEREGGSTRYVTKGDANEEADNGRTSYSEVIGKVVLTVPRLGYVLDFARSKNGFMFMVVIPAALIVLDELITIAGALRGMRRRKDAGVPVPEASELAPVSVRERARPLVWPVAPSVGGRWDGVTLRPARRTVHPALRGESEFRVVLRPV